LNASTELSQIKAGKRRWSPTQLLISRDSSGRHCEIAGHSWRRDAGRCRTFARGRIEGRSLSTEAGI